MKRLQVFTGSVLMSAMATIWAGGCSKHEEADLMTGAERTQSKPKAARQTDETPGLEKATFAAGCFWGVEAAFRKVEGVTSTSVGYTGGTLKNPSYRDVCSNLTGHAEAVEVIYDPSRVSYESLLQVFWNCHDPTTLNRQGPDVGTQYRSAIFVHNAEQERAAKASKEKLQRSGKYDRPIVTEIIPTSQFYRAEEYHQQYLAKQGKTSCSSTVH
jgi:peptide-methionine (S)-S-oxide reductase